MPSDPAELARDQLAIAQAASRQAFRGELEAKLAGDPEAYQALYDDWFVLVEFQQDMQMTPIDEVDSIVRNQSTDADGL